MSPDLIEKQRAAVRLFEASAAQRIGAGERALLVAEELGLQRSAVNAAVLSATKALFDRGLCRCSARATNSLPVPDSPVISTVMLERDSRPTARNTCCIAAA